jgi:hypothetical protein
MTLNHSDNSFNLSSIKIDFITINGNNKIFYLNNITGWTGLIKNGYLNGNIIVQNIITSSIGNTTLSSNAGYGFIVGSYFLRNGNGTNIIENCINNCNLTFGYHGGIIGENCLLDTSSTSINIVRNCINNGNNISFVSYGGGGIVSFNFAYFSNGTNIIEKCINNGTILTNGSGIAGSYCFSRSYNTNNTINNCVNTGNQTGAATGYGICINISQAACNISNCYSIGYSLASNVGILGTADNGNFKITNCYTLYGLLTTNTSGMVITNCYAANGNWLTSTAKTNLLISTNQWAFQRINGITDRTLPFTLLSQYPTNFSVYTDTALAPDYSTLPCFNKDTKILTSNGYVPIQNLRNGDIIKTYLHGYVPIYAIGYREMYNDNSNDNIKDKLYVCSKSEYSEIIEDLVITGCHSILVDEFKEGEREKTIKILGKIYETDEKYRLPACVDSRAKPYNSEGKFTIYHIALEHDDYFMNYGIYANGLLVESCSKRYLIELSGMTLIE